jgi:arylsulfatase A-like enzyme
MRDKQPNIVLVFVDNQPADMMGCSGNTEIHTPNLDRLAGKGVRFDQAFCPNAMCSPCRASVLTGLMPSQHGVHTWLDDGQMSAWPGGWNALDEFDTLPERLARAGYDTALVGKYHLGFPDEPQNDFAHWVTMDRGHVLSFYDNKMNDNGHVSTVSGHSVEYFTHKAVNYIEDHDKPDAAPFFLYLTYPAPYGHWPSVQGEPVNDFADFYRDMPMDSVPREGVSKELIDWIMMRHDKLPGEEDEYYRSLPRLLNDLPTLRNYYSQMSIVDDGVGRVLRQLEDSGLADDTVFIYTADHGMSLGQHGFWGHGEDTWPSNTHREAHNIPLIISGPDDLVPGSVNSSLVGTTDVFATILDYAGLEIPPKETMSGRSVRSLLDGKDDAWEQAVYMEQEETRSIRTKDWLFMQRFASSSYGFVNELYDLQADTEERINLAGEPAHQSTARELSAKIDAFFDQYADPKWNLWEGGTVKSNSTRPFLWQETWGEDWKPAY